MFYKKPAGKTSMTICLDVSERDSTSFSYMFRYVLPGHQGAPKLLWNTAWCSNMGVCNTWKHGIHFRTLSTLIFTLHKDYIKINRFHAGDCLKDQNTAVYLLARLSNCCSSKLSMLSRHAIIHSGSSRGELEELSTLDNVHASIQCGMSKPTLVEMLVGKILPYGAWLEPQLQSKTVELFSNPSYFPVPNVRPFHGGCDDTEASVPCCYCMVRHHSLCGWMWWRNSERPTLQFQMGFDEPQQYSLNQCCYQVP